jgi:cytochrome c553
MMQRCSRLLVLLILLLVAGQGPLLQAQSAAEDEEGIRFFEKEIRPLLVEHCYKCHGPKKQESDLRVDTLQGMLDGGGTGPAVVPGEPQQSLMLHALDYQDEELQMPPDERLSDRQIASITRWIETGAPHPEAKGVVVPRREAINWESARKFWSLQPVHDSDQPVVKSRRWPSNSIDYFVLQKLEQQGLKPAAEADRGSLIRRASLDLIGLPPTVSEVRLFVEDRQSGAYQRLLERLLASPHYGERWGRFWLDVARYADSNGLDENIAHGNAWRYRDYVIAAFNDDVPYDRFLHEQLAGDLLSSDNPATRARLVTATGFLSLGPKVLAEGDQVKMEMDIIDEQLDTIGRSLIGLTIGCARCHDHKFDPFSTKDYYALAGILKSTQTMESFARIARWHEHEVATPEQQQLFDDARLKVSQTNVAISELLVKANQQLLAKLGKDASLPEKPEPQYPQEIRDQLAKLRQDALTLEAAVPSLPTAMGVKDQDATDLAVHVRGSHLKLGDVVPRRMPQVFNDAPAVDGESSGRLQLAEWLTSPQHPLTSRVMANRIWRWHFGQGLVSSADNFGRLGAAPTHPQLLDHLAAGFLKRDWSIKEMHRWIMSSSSYRMSSQYDAGSQAVDPENLLLWRFPLRRLEAESLRDSLLAVSGLLDPSMGGSMLHVGNREFFFDHTSIDKTKYDSPRRSVYLPVVRNHLYDLFSLFDYSDASVINGSRTTSTVAPQALFLMNSELIERVSSGLADRLLELDHAGAHPDRLRRERLLQLYLIAYGRPPERRELDRDQRFLSSFLQQYTSTHSDQPMSVGRQAWQALCQVILVSNEFVYIR